MAENKKSFLLYCDLLEVAKELDNKSRGELFLYILEYVNDLNPEPPNQLVKMLFIPIKQALKRDLVKYENICDRNKINGSKGGRPKKPKEPNGLLGNPSKPKKADIDNDTDIDTDKEKDILLKQFLSWGIESGLDLDKVEDNFLNAFDYYKELDWKDKNGKLIVNLQSTIRKVWFKDLSKFKKEIKIDKTVLMAAQQIPAQMQSLMDKHKVSEQYLRDLYKK